MACFAMACRQVNPCPNRRACEAVWHACVPPDIRDVWHWICGDCHATWTLRTGGTWNRDPLPLTRTPHRRRATQKG